MTHPRPLDMSFEQFEHQLSRPNSVEFPLTDTAQLARITRVIQQFFGRRDLVDKEQLAIDIFMSDPTAVRAVIHHRCIDAWRACCRELTAREKRRVLGLSPPSASSHPLLRDEINRLCSDLTEEEKQVLCLHFWLGLSNVEIASKLGRRPWSVMLLYRRTIRKLRTAAYKEGLL